MSEWRPLGYRDHHQRGDLYWCECSGRCSEGGPCDCCELVELRAEIERLTARAEAAEAEAERLRAIVQRVTDLRDTYRRNITTAGNYVLSVPLAMIENSLSQALDGGSDE